LVAFAGFFAFAFVERAVFAARFVGFDFALFAADLDAGFVFELADAEGRFATPLRSSPLP
jgi:hypothetical protein